MKLIVSAVVLLTIACAARNPGIVIQINQSLLDYMKDTGLTVLAGTIGQASIPDQSGEESSLFHWYLRSIHITKFSASTSSAAIALTAPSGLTATLAHVSVALHADYEMKVGKGIFSISKSGSLDITAVADASADMQIGVSNERPQIGVSSCAGNIDNIDLTFHGDVIDDILNLFKGVIEKVVKDKLSGVICTEVTSLVASTLNPTLQGIPISIQLYDGFYLDYSVSSSAQVLANTIEAPFAGKIFFAGHENDDGIPSAAPIAPILGVSQHICFKLDVNEVLGSAFYAGIVSGKLHEELTEQILLSLGLPGLLACNCTAGPTCLISYLPGMEKICPSSESLGMTISMSTMPTISASAEGIVLSLTGQAAFTYKNSDYVVIEAAAMVGLPPHSLAFNNWKITAQLATQAGTLTVKSSKIGTIPVDKLSALYDSVVSLIIQGELNKLATNGFQLPAIPHIYPQAATFTIGTNTLSMCDNVAWH